MINTFLVPLYPLIINRSLYRKIRVMDCSYIFKQKEQAAVVCTQRPRRYTYICATAAPTRLVSISSSIDMVTSWAVAAFIAESWAPTFCRDKSSMFCRHFLEACVYITIRVRRLLHSSMYIKQWSVLLNSFLI